MRITFVKKILKSGEPCPKCADVSARLEASGQQARIDELIVADERDPDSAGMKLAAAHGVAVAPFFLVEQGGETTVYTVYLKFVREVLGGGVSGAQEAALQEAALQEAEEMLRADPNLDLI